MRTATGDGGGEDDGGVYVDAGGGGGLAGFVAIRDNVWPQTAGPLNYVSGAGFQSPRQWLAQPKVDGDVYRDVQLADGDYDVTVNGVHAGASL